MTATHAIHIDFSLFDSPTSSYGVITGALYVDTTPSIGDHVNITKNPNIYPHTLIVEDILPHPNIDNAPPTFMLSSVVLSTKEEAQKLVDYLEKQHNLFCAYHPNKI